jgi:hypothetical protein
MISSEFKKNDIYKGEPEGIGSPSISVWGRLPACGGFLIRLFGCKTIRAG